MRPARHVEDAVTVELEAKPPTRAPGERPDTPGWIVIRFSIRIELTAAAVDTPRKPACASAEPPSAFVPASAQPLTTAIEWPASI
jgi:hypothetical protein